MIIQKINRRLTNLESMCTFCSRTVYLVDNDYVATYSRRQYKTCHRSCYDNYLKYVKEVNSKCMK